MDRIPVAVLGATGVVGQRFVQLLADHPIFEITTLTASERKVGLRYSDACHWVLSPQPPPFAAGMILQSSEPNLNARVIFSALPASIATELEPQFAKAGYAVCSNSSAYRGAEAVPMIIPEVNADHLSLISSQQNERGWSGFIVTSPNCTTTGMVMPLKPLHEAFGLRQVFAVSMQAVSGAGYPGVPSLDIIDNVLTLIPGEEEKIERETRELLGLIADGRNIAADIIVSAQTNRVPVLDGHTICLSVGFEDKPTIKNAIDVLSGFRGPDSMRLLPSAPDHPIIVRPEPDRPQPRWDRDSENGMVVSVGRVRACPLLDLRMVTTVHNTLRGAASGSILNAELLAAENYLQ
jgi:aspartate-semialdehyde dehydrogenase